MSKQMFFHIFRSFCYNLNFVKRETLLQKKTINKGFPNSETLIKQ